MPTTPGGLPYPLGSDPVANGAQDIQDLAEAIDNRGKWTSYTPVLSSSGTQPSLGTGGTAVGKYIQINKFVHGYFNIQFGTSAITVGTGNYFVSLPVASARSTGAFWEQNVGTGTFGDNSTGTDYNMKFNFQSSTTLIAYYWTTFNGQLAALGAAAPVAIAVQDRITGFFTYEATTGGAA
jgi:hypothetical protein